MTKELITVTFSDGSSLELGTFKSNSWDAVVEQSGSLIIDS